MKNKKQYALYKGDNCIAIGTISEIAKRFKAQNKTISFYKTPSYKKRAFKGKNRRELVEC